MAEVYGTENRWAGWHPVRNEERERQESECSALSSRATTSMRSVAWCGVVPHLGGTRSGTEEWQAQVRQLRAQATSGGRVHAHGRETEPEARDGKERQNKGTEGYTGIVQGSIALRGREFRFFNFVS